MKKYFFLISFVFCSMFSAAPQAVSGQFYAFDFWDYLDYTTVVQGTVTRIDTIHDTSDTDTIFSLPSIQYQYVIQFSVNTWYKDKGRDTLTLKYFHTSTEHVIFEPITNEEWIIFTWRAPDGTYNAGHDFFSCPVNKKHTDTDKIIRLVKKYAQINNQVVAVKYKDHDSGKRRTAKGLLINGQPEGAWHFLDKKGVPYKTGYYLNGQRDSLWMSYYRDIKDNALPMIYSKTFIKNDKAASVSFTREGEMNYAYFDEGIEVPEGVFTQEEWTYIQEKGQKITNENY